MRVVGVRNRAFNWVSSCERLLTVSTMLTCNTSAEGQDPMFTWGCEKNASLGKEGCEDVLGVTNMNVFVDLENALASDHLLLLPR